MHQSNTRSPEPLRRRAPRVRLVHALVSRAAAAEQAHQPEDGKYDDADPEQVDQRARRVEQHPQHEKDDRSDDEHMDHFSSSPPVFTFSTVRMMSSSNALSQ